MTQPKPTCGDLTPHEAHSRYSAGPSGKGLIECPGVPNLAEPTVVTEDLGDLIRAEAARNPEFAAGVASAAGRCMDTDPHQPHVAGIESCPGIGAEPDGDPDPTWIALLDRARAGGEDAADAIIDAYSRGIRVGVERVATLPAEHAAAAAGDHRRWAHDLTRLARGLFDRGVDLGDDPVAAALAHIDRLDTALNEATRDGELLEFEGGITADQEIRARALHAAHDVANIGTHPHDVIDDAVLYEAYVRDGSVPSPGDDLDAEAVIGMAHARYRRAVNDEERAEVISELIGDWLAAWPRTAVTDPWDALAPEIVRMTRTNGDIVDAAIAYVTEPAGTDNVEPCWHDLKTAVEHHLAVAAPSTPDSRQETTP
jgi:hypothetical protein